MSWWIYLIITAILVVAELVYFKVADHFNIIDKPNARSSHKKVVVRGGGIVMVLGAWLYAAFFGFELWPFLAGLTLIAGISFIDDIHSLPDSLRLIVHFVAMVLMFYCWGILNWQSWWMVLLGLILCVGITNAYNFMDGINGINGGYTLAVLLPLAWINSQTPFVDQRLILVALLADLVFCFFNFRPSGKAKCFAGDVGSVGSAFIVIFVLGSLILAKGDFTYIVFLAVYGIDAVLTIIHRIMLHENLGEAHRKHAYQLMANELRIGHMKVSGFYAVLQLLIAVGMILIPDTPAWHWGYLVGVCLILAIAYLLFMKKYYHLHEEYLKSLKG
ncbi:MAG: glycosyltransferase family 4 protein [Bacteroidales bacterium]|nr:glycosyltransferase family 4 protein [Bacteroidales bacterium]